MTLRTTSGFDGTWRSARQRSRRDFWWFCRWVLGDEFFNNNAAAIENDFHRALCRFISKKRSVAKPIGVVLAPRGHLKSHIANLAHCIYVLCENPSERILMCHGILETAEKMVGNICVQFETNDRLKWLYPDVVWKHPRKESRTWGDAALTVKRPWEDNVPSLTASGIEGTKAGLHYTLIKDDDLTNDQNCNNVGQQQKAIDALERHMNLLRNERSKLDFLGTIWAYYDASWWLTAKENPMSRIASVFQRSCWVDPDLPDDLLEPIWPQGKTKQFLLNMRSTKTVLFSQQMLCRRVLEGSAVFDERTVRRYDLEWEDWGNGQLRYVLPDSRAVAVTEAREQRNYTKWMSMDLNNKQTEKSDYCVMTVGAKDDLGHLWLIDMKRGRPNVLHQIAWAIDMFIEHQPEMVMIETVAYQASFRTLLEKEAWSRNLSLPILEESRGTMLSKSTRIRLMQAPVGAGLLHVPDHPKFDPLMEEIRAYTGHKNDRDDCLDTVADLLTRIPPPAPAPRTKNRLTSFPVAGSISQSDMVESILARGIGHGVAFSANPRRGPVERARSR